MTDKTPKLLVDALGAIGSTQEFVAGMSLNVYLTATEDLEGLKVDLARLLAARG
jgi:hypothetical protein